MQVQPEFTASALTSSYERVLAVLGLGGATLGAAVVAYFDPTQVKIFPVCPLYEFTGFACPGCGLTRGFHALFHGDLVTALDFNALIPIWVVIFVYVWVSLLMLSIRGRGLPMWATHPKFLWTFLITLVTFGLLRNIPAYPFTVLFP